TTPSTAASLNQSAGFQLGTAGSSTASTLATAPTVGRSRGAAACASMMGAADSSTPTGASCAATRVVGPTLSTSARVSRRVSLFTGSSRWGSGRPGAGHRALAGPRSKAIWRSPGAPGRAAVASAPHHPLSAAHARHERPGTRTEGGEGQVVGEDDRARPVGAVDVLEDCRVIQQHADVAVRLRGGVVEHQVARQAL